MKVIKRQDIGNKGVIAMDMILSRASVPRLRARGNPRVVAAPVRPKTLTQPLRILAVSVRSLFERIDLAISTSRRVDGIWIGSYWGSPKHLARVEQALLLVKRHSPVHYSCIINNLERIWIFGLTHIGAEYNHSLKACVFDYRFLADPRASTKRIASVIVHEATHARLERCGITYDEDRRVRIEAICLRRELALAARLPDSAELQQLISEHLDWNGANPDFFSDAQFRERRRNGAIEALRQLDAPNWLIRAITTTQSMIGRVRRLFRIAWPPGSGWQKIAEEARILANQINDAEAKIAMLRIAEDYERLAQRAERQGPGASTKFKLSSARRGRRGWSAVPRPLTPEEIASNAIETSRSAGASGIWTKPVEPSSENACRTLPADLPVARNAQVSPAGAWRAFQQKQTARKISPAEFVFDKLVGTSINTSYALWLENATLRGAVGDATAREPALSVGFSPVAGRWYHLAYTFDDSGKRHAALPRWHLRHREAERPGDRRDGDMPAALAAVVSAVGREHHADSASTCPPSCSRSPTR